MHLVDVSFTDISFPCVFLEKKFVEFKYAKCMSFTIADQSMKRVDPFCMRVDVVPNYRLIRRGITGQSSDDYAYMVVSVPREF